MARLVQDYLRESAEKYPDKTAVEYEGESLSFAEFDRITNQLAQYLKKCGVRKGDRVSFCLPKSINAVVSLFAIVKADAVYVPLDMNAPAERLAHMIHDANPRIILCNNETEKKVCEAYDNREIISFERDGEAIASQTESIPAYKNNGSDIAYILYTSGSTGKPKGVMITHANIINATDWAVEELGITADDRMSQHPPLHFDLSTFDIYAAIKSGAALVLVPDKLSIFPGELMRWIEKKKLTIWNSVPSVMVYLSRAGLVEEARLPALKKIFFNGEAFPTKFLREWMETFPEKEFVNMYGPTEATVQSTYYRIPAAPRGDELVPIGKPCKNVTVIVAKDDGAEATTGEDGELWIGGAQIGRGYWNNQQKTNESFIEHPQYGRMYKTGDLGKRLPDGNFQFIGRKDNQIKHMGYRIELGDIDAALSALPYVNEAKTIAVADTETRGTKIVAFVMVPAALSAEKNESVIHGDLAKKLPPYMIPQEIILSSASLPRTSTGKIDGVALRQSYGKN